MKTIYVLTEGSYSDYHIIGVYSTKELAEEAQSFNQYLAEEAQSFNQYSVIEEHHLDNIPEYPPGMKAWIVQIENGGLNDLYTMQVSPFTEKIPREFEYMYPNHRIRYSVCCWAVDEKHAEKIALDKYYQHQATKAGIT